MAKKDQDSLTEETKTKKSSSKKDSKSSKSKDSKSKKPSLFARIKKWFHDLRSEFKKVTWPTKKTVINHTTVVISTIIIFSVFIGLLDEGLLKLMELLLDLGQSS